MLINEVGHENFGALVDIGNFMCADEEPWKSVAVMMPYAYHVHAKDFFLKRGVEPNPGKGWTLTRGGDYLRGTIIGHGDARVAQSLATVKRCGYDGFITVEFEGIEDNLLGIAEGLSNLKRFWDLT
jgi:sugar phosphate isomerase/epimerase